MRMEKRASDSCSGAFRGHLPSSRIVGRVLTLILLIADVALCVNAGHEAMAPGGRSPGVAPSRASNVLCFLVRSQPHRGFRGHQKESEGFLQIQAHRCIGMAEITDGDVLADVQYEITAPRGE